MLELVNILTQKEISLESDMIGVVILVFLCLFLIMFVTFINIHSINKLECFNKEKKCFTFKHRPFFIFTYSNKSKGISKRIFFMEMLGYILTSLIIVAIVLSFTIGGNVVLIFSVVVAVMVLIFACVVGCIENILKHKKQRKNK